MKLKRKDHTEESPGTWKPSELKLFIRADKRVVEAVEKAVIHAIEKFEKKE